MTIKSDVYNYTQNPLAGGNYTSVTAAGLQSTASGAKASNSGVNDNVTMWAPSNYTFLADQTSEITVSTTGNFDWPGAAVRLSTTGGGQGYILYFKQDASAMGLYALTAGVIGDPIGVFSGITIASGDKIKLGVVGTTFTAYHNGVSVGTATDATYASGQPGLAYEWGNTDASLITAWTGTDAAGATLFAQAAQSGPGISPDRRTMFRNRHLSAFIAPNSLGGGAASWQAGGYGQLTGTVAAPIIGFRREFGPGPSPDYQKGFQRPALSTTVPIIAAVSGAASWQAAAYGSLTATASIQGVASWQGVGNGAPLTGTAVLTGLASWQGAGLGNLGSGAVTNINGVASWQGSGYGVVTGAGALTGLASGQAAGNGSLTGAAVLTGTASWQGSGYGAAGGLGTLGGVASWQATSIGSLLGAVALQGRANAEGQAFGSLLGDGSLAGTASWSGGGYGTVLGVGALTGLASAQGGAFGSIDGALQLSGLASWQGFARGLVLPVGAGQMQGVAAAFCYAYGDLAGLSHAFGWAVITALSQNGLPVARACYIEESASRVTASYFDANGVPFAPSAVSYRIDDVASDANILPWTAITPDFANTITITSAQNAMISLSRTSESHQVLFQITDGFGNVSYADVSFDVIRVAGLG